jgi:hypothetical protein
VKSLNATLSEEEVTQEALNNQETSNDIPSSFEKSSELSA